MKRWLLLLAFASVASAQTYYEKTTIPPKIAAHTVLGNSTGATAAPGQLTSIPSSVVPVYSGDCGNAIATSTLVCTQAAANFNVVGTLSAGVLNAPTTVFAPQQINFTGTSNSTAAPNVEWNNTTGDTNYKAWNCNANSTGANGTFKCGTQTVNAAGEHDFLTVTRGGSNPYDISDVSFGSAGTSNNTTHFLGTGLITITPAVTITGALTASLTGTVGAVTPTTGAFTTVNATGLITPSTTVGIKGTAAADAAQAGSIGEVYAINCPVTAAAASATVVSFTSASPTVVTWSSHTFTTTGSPANYTCPINFPGGTPPTGVSAGVNYYIIGSTVSGDTFQISDTAPHALAGTNAINTSSTGTNPTAYIGNLGASTTSFAGAGIGLTAGDWDCSGLAEFQELTSITSTEFANSIDTSIVVTTIGNSTDIRTVTGVIGTNSLYLPTPIVRANISGTTLYYLVDKSTFSGGSMNEGGRLQCRRMR